MGHTEGELKGAAGPFQPCPYRMKQTGFQSTCRKREEKSPGSAQCSKLLTCRPLVPAARGPSLLWNPEQAFQQMWDCQMSYVILLPPVKAERLLNVWVLFSLAFRRSIAQLSAMSSCHINCAFWRHLRKSTLQKNGVALGFCICGPVWEMVVKQTIAAQSKKTLFLPSEPL